MAKPIYLLETIVKHSKTRALYWRLFSNGRVLLGSSPGLTSGSTILRGR